MKTSKKHRSLTQAETEQLERQGCFADDWTRVLVTQAFQADNIKNCNFSGTNYLGVYSDTIDFCGGVRKKTGLYNAHIHNCEVGDQVLISNIRNYIANYRIGRGVIIENTDLIMTDGSTTFGNGTMVAVLDETGGRKLMIYDRLSAHLAYIMVFYRHRDCIPGAIEKMIDDYTAKLRSNRGTIGEGSRISNSGEVINVRMGPHTSIQGASRLFEGSINSNAIAPVVVGCNVVAEHFIISSGSEVSQHAVLNHCFVGQGCILSKYYSAINSVFFSNCQGLNGEACSIFAGPFTVTHHKSTLLIAGMFSFTNAGSGSNQSNHMYKLGPIHHGKVERGSKTTSDSYLLWPARIGAFTLVMGRHYKNPDTSDMPFSYLVENKDDTWLAPAVNLRSVGTIRDATKWPQRDNRPDTDRLDCINYNLLSPFTIQRMINGRRILNQLKELSGETTETFTWGSTFISKKSLLRGISLYTVGIVKFLGNSVISRIGKYRPATATELTKCLNPECDTGKGSWIDLSGLIAPQQEIEKLLNRLERGTINLEETEQYFRELHAHYYEHEWAWSSELLESHLGKKINEITPQDLIRLVGEWKDCVVGLDRMLYDDAKKEFTLNAMTGFGPDGDLHTKELDFQKVRGTFKKNLLVTEILEHIKTKSSLAESTIEHLKSL